jgi:PilZ domain
MSLLARLDSDPKPGERRGSRRRKLRLEAEGAAALSGGTQVVIHDLSEDGMLLESSVALRTGERLDLLIPEAGSAGATIVWSSGRFFGCKFERPLPTAAVSAALLRGPAQGPRPSAPTDNESALYIAMVELKALAKEIERITDQVDRAIVRLNKDRR